jgi:hypothetical protein
MALAGPRRCASEACSRFLLSLPIAPSGADQSGGYYTGSAAREKQATDFRKGAVFERLAVVRAPLA